jgi:dTDP-glucose 4,6-dehydratase
MNKTVLVTGAGGFVGHHFLEHVLVSTDWDAVCTDSFRHKGRTDRISEVLYNQGLHNGESWRHRTAVITHDLTAPFSGGQELALASMDIDYMVCFASDSHVDRSITDPVPFIRNNTEVALNTLELARKLKPKVVVWVSTDEVYGPVEASDLKGHPEWAPILPSNPYSASKAAQEAIAISYWRTYGVPLVIVNCMNMIGERQDPEKFIPLVIGKVLNGEEVTIHGKPGNIGTRHYLHSRNLADAITFILGNLSPAMFPAHAAASGGITTIALNGRPDRYNIASPDRIDNLTVAKMISEFAGKPLKYKLEDFHTTRPGHDPHYGLDSSKLTELGWKLPVPFRDSLRKTVEWTMAHPAWLRGDGTL